MDQITEKVKPSLLFTIGVFMLLLGILMDDATTYYLILNGFQNMEANPIYLLFGTGGMFIASLLIYGFMIGAWGFVIKTYKKAYINRSIGYKIMDISVFIFCMMIVFITSSKILLGISNLNTINHMDDTEVKKSLEYHNALKLSDPEAYNSEMSNYYKTKITSNLNLGFVMFNIIIAYLLFRIGYKVQPWEA